MNGKNLIAVCDCVINNRNDKKRPRKLKILGRLNMCRYLIFYLKLSFKASKASIPGQRISSLSMFNGVLVV